MRAAFFSVLLAVNVAMASSATVLSVPAQTLKGWGAFPSTTSLSSQPAATQDAVYALGFSVFRTWIPTGVYVSGSTVSDITLDPTVFAGLVHEIQVGRTHGVAQYVLSNWTPPSQWKLPEQTFNGVASDGGPESLDSAFEDAYVAFYTKVLLSLKMQGLPLPMAVSIQNEPNVAPPGWIGCLYSAAQWQRVFKAMRASFDANGLSGVVLLGPEVGNFSPTVTGPAGQDGGFLGGPGYPILGSDPTLDASLGAYALHSYSRCHAADNALGMSNYPKDAWMTEWSNTTAATTDLQWSIDMVRGLDADLEGLPFNYWFWWEVWQDHPLASQTLIGGTTSLSYSKRYWVLKKLWSTVKPGWSVVHMTTDDPDLKVDIAGEGCALVVDLLAFREPSTGRQTVVLVNYTANPKALTVNGMHGTQAEAFRTSGTEDMADVGAVVIANGAAPLTLPPQSVTLLVERALAATDGGTGIDGGAPVDGGAGLATDAGAAFTDGGSTGLMAGGHGCSSASASFGGVLPLALLILTMRVRAGQRRQLIKP